MYDAFLNCRETDAAHAHTDMINLIIKPQTNEI